MKVYLWNDIKSEDHLLSVVEDMKVLGAPVIYFVTVNEYNYALNGSHRLFAASMLGIEPIFRQLEYDGGVQGGWSTSMLAAANNIYDDELHNEDCHHPNCHLLENVLKPHGQPFLYFLNK